MAVIVLGSINIDLVVQVSHLPHKGETVIGNNFFTACGGKGANGAVAIAKLGIPVSMVGQVGGDQFGETLLKGLQSAGVNTQGVIINPDTHSGVASIVVDQHGDNTIACAGGANSLVGDAEIQQFKALLPGAKVVSLELGIPLDVVVAAASAASAADCIVILDPAPARNDLPDELYPLIDIITPNEVEASQLVGFPVIDPETATRAALILQQRGVKTVIVTLGSQGALCCSANETFFVPALSVSVVDTVAAGDAFNGGLVAALASGKSLPEAMQWATVAGALSVTQAGAQSSLPDRASFLQFLSSH
ncbi:ribokinase [Gloeothece verrucosa]|uniref:Ribokinase n=1 Tax=Gloeothece verrucosa (strain PCC 7822) TaxID=497965 RepID=E0UHD4_GLOV7|nr:ribokinase [Gloeothece verrucosa]ADN16848.1 ribokinase [Gloeothece verrucosa PCC 7822]